MIPSLATRCSLRLTLGPPLLALLLLLACPPALAGGTEEPGPPRFDPADFAVRSALESEPASGQTLFGLGGRFAGDVDGDGADEILVQNREGNRLRMWFGDAAWLGGEPGSLGEGGEVSLEVPPGCLRADGTLAYAALDDINADGYDDVGLACWDYQNALGETVGAFLFWLGQPRPWPASPVAATWIVLGAEGDPGLRAGGDIAPLSDVESVGSRDLVLVGASYADPNEPRIWVVRSALDIGPSGPELEQATYTFTSSSDARCMEPMSVASVGDFEGDGKDDFALVCSRQPGVADPGPDNSVDLGYSLLLSSSRPALASEESLVAIRDLSRDAGTQFIPQAQPFAALGDLDGDGRGEAALVTWFEGGDSLSGQVLRGSDGASGVIDVLSPFTPFLLSGDYDDPRGLQLAPAGLLPGLDGAAVWIRWGEGEEAGIGLLESYDSALWPDPLEPDARLVFTAPGATPPAEARRLSLGGPGDADGDGVPDLLILGGHDDGDCTPETCGGFWLVLCGDVDGDGVSVCAGDCDDGDAARFPGAAEVCDSVDHDCDGSDGQIDADGDGVLACAGDCDDTDALRAPGKVETCEDEEDLDCDGLTPQDDEDGDGSSNCEDCQPWLDSIHPGALEVCDGLDNDCNGALPADETDFDGDGWPACARGELPGDCDDYSPFVHPGHFEDCRNGIDDDCDGVIDDEADADEDGVLTCEGDCDDSNPDVFPGAEELCDGLDNNCDGDVDDARDLDGDGSSPCDGDCDEDDPERHPGAPGSCEGGVDANCDGVDDLLDDDGDGWSACGGDCDETDPGINPGAFEYCDALDNDCSGAADEPFDEDGDGWASCLGDCEDTSADRFPAAVEPDCEDGVDGDCDLLGDSADTDCPPAAEVTEPGLRPYGLSCSDCASSYGGEAAQPARWLLVLVLLPLLRRRRSPTPRLRGPRERAALGGSALLLSLLCGAPGAQAASPERAVVVYLAPQPDMQGMVAARELLTDFEAVEILHSSELFSPAGDRILARGVPRAYACPAGGNAPEMVDTVSRVLDRLIQVDNRGALRIFEHTMRELPCLDEPLMQGVLADLLYYRGLAELGLGNRQAAEVAFRNALGIKPDYQGDPNFPPESNRVLEEVRSNRLSWPWVPIEAFASSGAILRVDGTDWNPASERLDLHPGLHVVQYRRRGRTWTLVLDLREEDRPFLIHSQDRLDALRAVPRSVAAQTWAGDVLGFAAGDRSVDLVAVVDIESSPARLSYLYRSDTNSYSFQRGYGGSAAERRRAERESRDSTWGSKKRAAPGPAAGSSASSGSGESIQLRTRDRADRFRLRLSGGFAYIHPFAYALIPVDISVRLVAGLCIDVGGEVGLNRSEEYGLTWLPGGQAGLSYRFAVGLVQPRVGAVVRLSADRSPDADSGMELRVGWAVRGGFDVTPGGGAGLLSLDAQVGMFGAPLFVAVTGGGGFRF